ncbi:MAG: hypothetical protein R3266_07325, partial [Gemmatimonadota bacterium]|nr:hypothetical protein [Gemmatimonadota bacterium]
LVGVLWLIAATAFVAAAVGLLSAGPWWLGLASFAAVLSLFLTVLEWPETRMGLQLDVVLLAVLLSQAAYDWLPGPA